MLGAIVQWLDRVGPMIFWTCAIALITIDTAAVATVIGTKSRELVNRWTGAIVIANALLLGTGVGVPAMMYVTKVAVQAVAPSAQLSIVPVTTADER
jgi:hypothetical protein